MTPETLERCIKLAEAAYAAHRAGGFNRYQVGSNLRDLLDLLKAELASKQEEGR